MKKIIFLGVACSMISLTSCDKTYECYTEHSKEVYSTGTYSESEMETFKSACEAADGDWVLKPRFY